MAIWGDFQGLTGATGGGRVVKNRENEATSFMDAPLWKGLINLAVAGPQEFFKHCSFSYELFPPVPPCSSVLT